MTEIKKHILRIRAAKGNTYLEGEQKVPYGRITISHKDLIPGKEYEIDFVAREHENKE